MFCRKLCEWEEQNDGNIVQPNLQDVMDMEENVIDNPDNVSNTVLENRKNIENIDMDWECTNVLKWKGQASYYHLKFRIWEIVEIS